jgi:hypothetical protein
MTDNLMSIARLFALTAIAFVAIPTAFAAQPEADEDPDQPVARTESNDEPATQTAPKDTKDETPVDYGPTDIGVRMTPAIAKAISGRMTSQMKDRYSLDDKQMDGVATAIEKNIMKLAHENATVGRDAFEMMMATMIANDGEFPKESAVEFAKGIKPLIPALRQFFMDSAADVGKVMTFKQKLQFTGDMTALTAGIGIFEERMKRWEAGDVADGANPFFDRPGASDDDEDINPDEPREIRQARRQVDRSMAWTLNFETNWEQYVRNAVIFYDFDEEQQTAANGILEECKARAAGIKSDEWLKKYRSNRIADRLSWRLDSKFNNGPFKFQLERAHEKLMKPLNDIGDELKKRIETLPTSKQRFEARKAAEKALQERGLDTFPL